MVLEVPVYDICRLARQQKALGDLVVEISVEAADVCGVVRRGRGAGDQARHTRGVRPRVGRRIVSEILVNPGRTSVGPRVGQTIGIVENNGRGRGPGESQVGGARMDVIDVEHADMVQSDRGGRSTVALDGTPWRRVEPPEEERATIGFAPKSLIDSGDPRLHPRGQSGDGEEREG
jgi:hypothetical protein